MKKPSIASEITSYREIPEGLTKNGELREDSYLANRTYRVFISSTFRDLEEARKEAIAGVTDCNHIPIALERFVPENTEDLTVIKREVKYCHVYVVILGPRYGQIPEGKDRSYTEIEFDNAVKLGRYIMVFALDKVEVKIQRDNFKSSCEADRIELQNEDKFWDFYNKATNGKRFWKPWHWRDPSSIRRNLNQALGRLPLLPEAPRGLVPERDIDSDRFVFAAQNEFVREIIGSITGFEKLYARLTAHVEEKMRAGEFFSRLYSARLESPEVKGVFFESGSNIAFVARELQDRLWDHVKIHVPEKPSKRISTNNVLVYLLLWLSKGVPCNLFPEGEPEETYGASYGPINSLGDHYPTFSSPQPELRRIKEVFNQLKKSPLGLNKETTSLLITASSGLQVGSNHNIVAPEGHGIYGQDRDSINECFGPHVGSFKNNIFKRYLYSTGIPSVLFIDSSKVDCVINPVHCHFLFLPDEELTWNMIVEEYPLAICVGCLTNELNALQTLFDETFPSFETKRSSTTRPYSAFIATNEVFRSQFPE